MDFLNFSSVETIPGIKARAAFQLKTTAVFKEDGDITGIKTKRATVWMSVGREKRWYSVRLWVKEVDRREKRNVQKVEFALIGVEFWGASV